MAAAGTTATRPHAATTVTARGTLLHELLGALLAFFLFRILDVWKPGPIGALERLPGGWGIMADDLLGGAVAAGMVAAGLLLKR